MQKIITRIKTTVGGVDTLARAVKSCLLALTGRTLNQSPAQPIQQDQSSNQEPTCAKQIATQRGLQPRPVARKVRPRANPRTKKDN